MLEGEDKSQVVETPVSSPDGETQPTDAVVTAQPGAEDKPTVEAPKAPEPVKTYTEAELKEQVARETSAIQKREAEAQRMLNQINMQREIDAAAQREAQAAAQDTQAVADGIITETEAARRATLRQQTAHAEWQLRQTQQTVAQQEARANLYARIDFANDVAKRFGVEPEGLLKDESLQDPASMIQKAAVLKIQKLEEELRKAKAVPEHYDTGPGGGGRGGSLDTPEGVEKAMREIYDKD